MRGVEVVNVPTIPYLQYMQYSHLMQQVVELAVTASANAIVTHNLADFARSELKFPDLLNLSPAECLRRFP